MRVLKEVPHGWVETGFLEPLKTGTHWREAAAAFSAGGEGWGVGVGGGGEAFYAL